MTIAVPSTDLLDRPRGGPTVLRILLGAQLRRLREAKELSREAAGFAIRGSESKISRLELGRVGFKERDVADLLALYGVAEGPQREALLSLARRANEPGWWHQFADVLPSWFEMYLGLEQAATRIREYEVQFVPGLLQTEAYARAVARLGHPAAAGDEIERRVRLRMTRQRVLSGPHSPHVWAVVDEAVLCRSLGGRETMRAQLRHLIAVSRLPHVTLQVVPFEHGGHAAAGGAFSILRFAQQDLPDVVYMEQLTSALYLDKPADVDRYLAVMERLCLDAEPAAATNGILTGILERL